MMFVAIHSALLCAGPVFLWNEVFGIRSVSAASDSDNTGEDKANGKNKDNLVITPGGPRPAEQVHPVGPGQVVRRNPDGTYSVVPDTTPDSNKETPPT
jgi:hypothetical protein